MSELHVYETPTVPGSRLMIGTFEGRARPVLALQHNGGIAILASFHSEDACEAAVLFIDAAFNEVNRVIRHYAAKYGETITDDGHAEGLIQGDGAASPSPDDRSPYLEGGSSEPNAG